VAYPRRRNGRLLLSEQPLPQRGSRRRDKPAVPTVIARLQARRKACPLLGFAPCV